MRAKVLNFWHMQIIRLTQGHIALVDDRDAEKVGCHSWYARRKGRNVYAFAHIGNRIIGMHQLIRGAKRGKVIDHVNGHGLDNRRRNLQHITTAQNIRKGRLSVRNRSGYRGVSWAPHAKKWRAVIRIDGKYHNLGYFADPQEASNAYLTALQNSGEFRCGSL